MALKLTQEEFLYNSKIKHENNYDYSKVEYTTAHDKVCIICPIHGEFWKSPANHTHKTRPQGCPICKIKEISIKFAHSTEKFIEKAKLKHGDIYNYNFVNYINDREKVIITCPLHGDFEQCASSHLQGCGCPKCSLIGNTFVKKEWINKAKSKEGVFYIIRCFNEAESFYKLGITFNSIYKRYLSKRDMPYNYEIIQEIKSKDLSYIWDLEVYFKKFINMDNLNYLPIIPFGGSITECFKPN